ncbi:MAG: diguanylate cyclase [Acetobacteraceae bacterium]
MSDTASTDRPLAGSLAQADVLRGALLDSRQRWREIVTLAADFVFETDCWGRFVLVMPETVLGWSASTLVGQPAALLLPPPTDGPSFDPFRTAVAVRRKRVWLKRADGSLACLGLAAMPLHDAAGALTGVRGVAFDMTEYDVQGAQVAAALRRGEVLDHILTRTGNEVYAPLMMSAALNALVNALGAEGAAVILMPSEGGSPRLAHQAGSGGKTLLREAARLLPAPNGDAAQSTSLDGRPVLVASCQTRFGDHGGVAVWRAADARGWDNDDRLLVGSAGKIIRMVLEHEAIQQEMNRQARTDPLTGLLNRRAFIEEVDRHLDRLDREDLPGTLMFVDLDHFKAINDALGHEAGDRVLMQLAALLRRLVRPSDLVARLGGDEFAVWLSGADHMTAAERADYLREVAPNEFVEVTSADAPRSGVSIGIACRNRGSHEPLDSLMRRADVAMYEVKRNGRGHWRVSLENPE